MPYKQASRIKLRFNSPKGLLGVEDLWDLPLTSATGKANLDDIAKDVNRQLKESKEESFVAKETKGNSILQLQLDVLKDVIQVKLAEAAAAATARENAEKKQQILALIEQKKNEQLAGASLEDLIKMVEGM